TIVDNWKGSTRPPLCNFFVPHEGCVSLAEDGKSFSFFKDSILLKVSVFGGTARLVKGVGFEDWSGEVLTPCFSPSYGKFESCENVVITKDEGSLSMIYDIEW